MFRHRHDHDSEEALVDKLRDRFPIAKARLTQRQAGRARERQALLTVGGAALLASPSST